MISFIEIADGLRLTEVRIPNHTVRDQSARLECHFDLDGETLYSVKWYKDGNEFYRYVPMERPPVQVFQLPGVTVDVSTDSHLMTSRNDEPVFFFFSYTILRKMLSFCHL